MKFFFILFLPFLALGKTHEVHQVLSIYQKQKSVTMNIEKTFTQPLLKKNTTSKGQLYLAQKLWRLDVLHPQKSSFIFNGKNITYTSNSGSHHISSSKTPVISIIFDPKTFEKTFKYEHKTKKGRTWIHHFKGLTPSAPKKISIQIEKNRILSLSIEWKESLGKEMYRFSSILFNSPLNQDIFKVSL